MSSVRITSIETEGVDGSNRTLFNPFTDPLKLTMFVSLSPDLVNMPNIVVGGTFQLLELRTNLIVVDHYVQSNYNSALGPNFFWWLGSPTPHDWGLQWTGGDVFGFRAAIEVFQWQGASGLAAVDAFDVSSVRWFRLMDVFSL